MFRFNLYQFSVPDYNVNYYQIAPPSSKYIFVEMLISKRRDNSKFGTASSILVALLYAAFCVKSGRPWIQHPAWFMCCIIGCFLGARPPIVSVAQSKYALVSPQFWRNNNYMPHNVPAMSLCDSCIGYYIHMLLLYIYVCYVFIKHVYTLCMLYWNEISYSLIKGYDVACSPASHAFWTDDHDLPAIRVFHKHRPSGRTDHAASEPQQRAGVLYKQTIRHVVAGAVE